MKKLQTLGKSLSKIEQKKIVGGFIDPGGGACYYAYSDQGYSSCWYVTGSEVDMCERVYPGHCSHVSNAVDCSANNCTMN